MKYFFLSAGESSKDMDTILSAIILISLFLLFLYYGYKDDFKRDPKEFKKAVLGTLAIIFTPIFGIFGLSYFIEKWINKKEEKLHGKNDV